MWNKDYHHIITGGETAYAAASVSYYYPITLLLTKVKIF
jgi:hypothetical protein